MSALTSNKSVLSWIDEKVELVKPDRIVWIDGSKEQIEELKSASTQKFEKLSEEKEVLNQKVALAAQLDATNIRLEMTNKRGKETDNLKRATQFNISFDIAKNPTATTLSLPRGSLKREKRRKPLRLPFPPATIQSR